MFIKVARNHHKLYGIPAFRVLPFSFVTNHQPISHLSLAHLGLFRAQHHGTGHRRGLPVGLFHRQRQHRDATGQRWENLGFHVLEDTPYPTDLFWSFLTVGLGLLALELRR